MRAPERGVRSPPVGVYCSVLINASGVFERTRYRPICRTRVRGGRYYFTIPALHPVHRRACRRTCAFALSLHPQRRGRICTNPRPDAKGTETATAIMAIAGRAPIVDLGALNDTTVAARLVSMGTAGFSSYVHDTVSPRLTATSTVCRRPTPRTSSDRVRSTAQRRTVRIPLYTPSSRGTRELGQGLSTISGLPAH